MANVALVRLFIGVKTTMKRQLSQVVKGFRTIGTFVLATVDLERDNKHYQVIMCRGDDINLCLAPLGKNMSGRLCINVTQDSDAIEVHSAWAGRDHCPRPWQQDEKAVSCVTFVSQRVSVGLCLFLLVCVCLSVCFCLSVCLCVSDCVCF